MKIEGEKINLRKVGVDDFEKIIKWHQNKILIYLAGNRLPKNKEECKDRYLKNNLLHYILAIEDKSGNFVGEIEINHIQWKEKIAELFMYIGEENLWGKGYGTEALSMFIDYIFKVMGFKTIYLRVYKSNKRAIRCYEKCGFKKKGILKLKNHKSLGDDLILMEKKVDV
ncbi:MAG: GNAT family N-acetyltransferase [Tepidanaerobacteraceae bacterium]|jgi:RimJ/RimL family protein N-acetyltransferase|nr:GNAT family N-acetyltransferase [Tepidanaerobacteraceae bacterium]